MPVPQAVPASPLSIIAGDPNISPAFRRVLGGGHDRVQRTEAALTRLDQGLTGGGPAPDAGREAAAQAVLDDLAAAELHAFHGARLQLERRLGVIARETGGTAAGAEALRLLNAVAGLLRTPSARSLIAFRTSRQKAEALACQAATETALQRAYHTDPDFSTVGD